MEQEPTQMRIDSIVVVSRQQISCQLSGEVVILHPGEGIYYGLNEVGGRVWSLIQEPRKVKDILTVLVDEFDVDPERCESDVFKILNDLAAKGLVEVRGESST